MLFQIIKIYTVFMVFLKLLDTLFQEDRKCSKIVWYALIHIVCTVMDLQYMNSEYVLTSHFSRQLKDQQYEDSLEDVYIFTFGIWASIIISESTVFSRTKDADSTVMLLHHFLAVSLLVI